RNSLVKAFEPSSCAGARCGPKHRRPAALNASTTPSTSGASGPMMVSATCSLRASATSASMSSAATATLRSFGSSAVPALPGATSTCVTRADCAHFHASACSRPPEPTTRTFMGWRPASMAEMAHAGEYHGEAVLVGRGDDLGVALRAARLDHRGDAELRRDVDTVAKREESVRGHHGATHFELLVRCLHRGDAGRIHAAHLPGADAYRHVVAGEHDRVRLHVLADGP